MSLFLLFIPSTLAAPATSDQLLESITYTNNVEEYIVEFNREEMYGIFYDHVAKNIPELSNDEKVRLANELLDSAKNARESALEQSMLIRTTKFYVSNPVPISIGKIVDGKLMTGDLSFENMGIDSDANLTSADPGRYWNPDSRTTIISHGFSITPYLSSGESWVTHATSWRGVDRYKLENGAYWTNDSNLSVSKQMGYTGSLLASDASDYGLTVTPTTTQTMTIPLGETFLIPAWTNKQVRPYISWWQNKYTAQYEYYAYNSSTQTYFYHRVNLSATNVNYISKDKQFWSAENTSKNPNATSPQPPSGWY